MIIRKCYHLRRFEDRVFDATRTLGTRGGVTYRCYDKRGRLLHAGAAKRLYAGLLLYPKDRWFRKMAYVAVDKHPTKAAAKAAVEGICAREHPLYDCFGRRIPRPADGSAVFLYRRSYASRGGRRFVKYIPSTARMWAAGSRWLAAKHRSRMIREGRRLIRRGDGLLGDIRAAGGGISPSAYFRNLEALDAADRASDRREDPERWTPENYFKKLGEFASALGLEGSARSLDTGRRRAPRRRSEDDFLIPDVEPPQPRGTIYDPDPLLEP